MMTATALTKSSSVRALTFSPLMTFLEHEVALCVQVFSLKHQLQAKALVTHAEHLETEACTRTQQSD